LIFSVNRKWTRCTTSLQKLNMRQGCQKKVYFGQWQFITKIYPVNAICLLK